MNKIVKHIVVFVGLFCFASLARAVEIPDPLGGATICGLLTKIATGVGTVVAALGTTMIIVAGIFYLTSAGSPERTGVAKKTLSSKLKAIKESGNKLDIATLLQIKNYRAEIEALNSQMKLTKDSIKAILEGKIKLLVKELDYEGLDKLFAEITAVQTKRYDILVQVESKVNAMLLLVS